MQPDVEDDKTNTEMWYCNYFNIIVLNSNEKLIDKTRYRGSVVISKSVRCRLREYKNTEFVWELKRGFKQGGLKYSCPLTRVSVKRALTVHQG